MTGLYVRDIRDLGGPIAEFLRRREEEGLDRWDEVWEGVQHMSPPPHGGHGKVLAWLGAVFLAQAQRHGLGTVYIQPGLREPGSELRNYRVPDIAVLPPEGELVDGWIEDGASLVTEVRSPREVVIEKLAFYARRGVGEVLYIDYRSFSFDLFRLAGDSYVAVSPDREGFCEIRALALRVRRQGSATGGSVVAGEGRGASLEFEDARGGGPLPPL